MVSGQRRRVGLGCLVALMMGLLLIFVEIGSFIGTIRVPHEIPLEALLETQVEALGSDWTLDTDGTIYTDTDFTSAAWAYYADFDHTNWQYSAALEVHTFRSPGLAKSRLSPSPMAVNVVKDGNWPAGWSYVPPNADRFVLDCRGEPNLEGCYVLLVYQEYSMVYAIDIGTGTTLADLQRFLEATDAFMADFLATTTLEQGRRQAPTLFELGLPGAR